MALNIVEKALKLQNGNYYKLGHFILSVFGVEIPKQVFIKQLGGADTIRLVHRAPGTVIHPKTSIGQRVHIYQGVTIGKKRLWESQEFEGGCEIQDDVILCAGAKVLFGSEKLVVGKGSVIGANAVLTCSTGEYEIWAGIPAKCVGKRN